MESHATIAGGIETASFDVAVVEPDFSTRTRLALELSGARQYESIEELAQGVQSGRALVAVFGPGFVSPMGFQHVHRLTGEYPEIGAVFAVAELLFGSISSVPPTTQAMPPSPPASVEGPESVG